VSSRDGVIEICTRDNRSDERGFTIIELTVAMGLLALVAASLAGVFWSAIRTASIANHRTDGASIASREIEGMRAVPYAQVGFYQDQPGYVTSFESLATVSLGGSSPASGANVPEMQPLTPDPSAADNYAPDPDASNAHPIKLGNIDFSVKRYVVWVDAKDAPSHTDTQAYKRLTVIVTWTDVVGSHTVREDSLLYPGGQGPYSGVQGGSGTTTTTVHVGNPAPIAPVVAVTVPADPQGETAVQLNWSQTGTGGTTDKFSIEWSTDSSFPQNNFTIVNDLPNSQTTYTATSLTASTTYYFEVIAYGSGGSTSSNVVSATTLAPPAACNIGALSVAGATSKSTTGTFLAKNGKMTENLTLTFTTTGTCGAYTVVGKDPSNATDPSSPYALTKSGTTYTATIASANNKGWAIGIHKFTVWDTGTGAATTAVKSFQVCSSSASSC
jgi:prepilin-type N-terminal cleavage/methylation domain-containing protein